eukprot:1810789-Rhodomonas_salina.1
MAPVSAKMAVWSRPAHAGHVTAYPRHVTALRGHVPLTDGHVKARNQGQSTTAVARFVRELSVLHLFFFLFSSTWPVGTVARRGRRSSILMHLVAPYAGSVLDMA